MRQYEDRMREINPSFRPFPNADIIPLFSENQSRPPLPEASISRLEDELGVLLADGYKKFLMDYGAIFIHRTIFFFREAGSSSSDYIEQLYGIVPDMPAEDILTQFRDYRGRIPSDLLPIGEDPGGNIICLGLLGERRGKVYFWDHEREEMPPDEAPPDWEPGDSNVSFIANSFDEFFFSLQPQQ